MFQLLTSFFRQDSISKEDLEGAISLLKEGAEHLEKMPAKTKEDDSGKTKMEEKMNSLQKYIQKLENEKKEIHEIDELISAFGGLDNISRFGNCASRLRYDIVDKSKVDEAALKSAGVLGIKWIGEGHIQAVIGPKAGLINEKIFEKTKEVE